MGGAGVCGRGEKGGAFCSVCIFHNQKMHVYLIFIVSPKDDRFGKNTNLLTIAARLYFWTRGTCNTDSHAVRVPREQQSCECFSWRA